MSRRRKVTSEKEPNVESLLTSVGRGVTTYIGRAHDIEWATQGLMAAGLRPPEWVLQCSDELYHVVPNYDASLPEIVFPVDKASWAAYGIIGILRHWRACLRYPAWIEAERAHVFARMKALGAAATLLQWLEDKVAQWLFTEGAVSLGGIEASSYHAWCGLAARRILNRAFRRGIIEPHRALARGTQSTCQPITVDLTPSLTIWVDGMDEVVLQCVESRLRAEWSSAWRRVLNDARRREAPPKPPVRATDGLQWRLFLLLYHRECNLSEAQRALAATAEDQRCDYGTLSGWVTTWRKSLLITGGAKRFGLVLTESGREELKKNYDVQAPPWLVEVLALLDAPRPRRRGRRRARL